MRPNPASNRTGKSSVVMLAEESWMLFMTVVSFGREIPVRAVVLFVSRESNTTRFGNVNVPSSVELAIIQR